MTSIIDTALNWLSMNIVPIPCKPGTKIPTIAWKQYQSTMPAEIKVLKWFRNPCNMAVVTGGMQNLTVLDFDSIPLYWKWRKLNSELATTYTVSTPRPGKHVYFFLNEQCGTKIKLIDGVDIKGNRGIVIVPPSIIKRPYSIAVDATIKKYKSLDDIIHGIEPDKKEVYEPVYKIEKKVSNTESDRIVYIKNNLSILELARRYIQLYNTDGVGRWWMGICPVHNDKNPSFRVDALYNKCGCFSQHCEMHDGGDVIDLYAAINNVSISESIERLYEQLVN